MRLLPLLFLVLACSRAAPVEVTAPASEQIASQEIAIAEQRAVNDSLHKMVLTGFTQKKEESYDHALERSIVCGKAFKKSMKAGTLLLIQRIWSVQDKL